MIFVLMSFLNNNSDDDGMYFDNYKGTGDRDLSFLVVDLWGKAKHGIVG